MKDNEACLNQNFVQPNQAPILHMPNQFHKQTAGNNQNMNE